MLKVLSPQEMKDAMAQSIPKKLSKQKRKEYCITEEQEQNLRILLVGLERLLPTHKDIFNMGSYFIPPCEDGDNGNDDSLARYGTVEHPCGSSACAVGYAPSCGIPIGEDEYWTPFAVRCFGGRRTSRPDINDFMFSSAWVRGENQMAEAIERIKIVLAGDVPEDFEYSETYT